jgi:hypothetical protein
MNNTLGLLLLAATLLFPIPASLRASDKITDAAPTKSIPGDKVTDAGFSRKTGDYFEFRGGSPADFLNEIKAFYGIDVGKITTLPAGYDTISVPKMRLKRGNYRNALDLYNTLSGKDSRLGRWIIGEQWVTEKGVRGPEISSILFELPQQDSSFAVRAFSISEPEAVNLDHLRSSIDVQVEIESHLTTSSQRRTALMGNLQYHKSTGILVVSGGNLYVETAAAMIEAFKSGRGASAPKPVQ